MKTTTIIKSTLSGVAGALIVILVLFLYTQHKDNTSDNITLEDKQSEKVDKIPPIHKSKFSPQQSVDLTYAAEKSLDAVVHIKTKIISRTNSYDDFFGQFKEYFHQYPQRSNSYVAFGSGVIISSFSLEKWEMSAWRNRVGFPSGL